MLIDSVIKNEALRNLKYRKNGKICDSYIGKDSSRVAGIREHLAQRKHCESMLTTLKIEQKKNPKILEVLA